jgi:hypothetical protein
VPKLGLPVRRRCVLVLAPAPCWHAPPNVSRLPTQPIAWAHGGQQGRLHTELADILALHKTAIQSINPSRSPSLSVCLSIYLCHLESLVGASHCLGARISSVSQSTWGLFPAFTSRFWPSSQPRSTQFEDSVRRDDNVHHSEQCPGKFFGRIGQNPSVSKSNRSQVVISRLFLH